MAKLCCEGVDIPESCPTDCESYTDTNCVVETSALECLDLDANSTQHDINLAIDEKLCECVTWTDVDITATDWVDIDAAQNLQYSSLDKCIVRLRGTISNSITSGEVYSSVFTLPSDRRPLLTRYFSATNIGSGLVGSMHIRIQGVADVAPGLVSVFLPFIFAPANITVSFDGLTFEIN